MVNIHFIYDFPLKKDTYKTHTYDSYIMKHFFDDDNNFMNFDDKNHLKNIEEYLPYINFDYLEFVESIYGYTVFKLNIRKIKIEKLLNIN